MQTIKLTGPVGDEGFNVRLLDDLTPGPVTVIIDSGGGCIVNGLAIFQKLIDHPGKVTTETIKAGSAAVLPALAGSHRVIHGSGYFFVHQCWGSVTGRAADMYQAAHTFREQNTLYAEILAERTSLTLRVIRKMMLDESQISSTEAVRLNFAQDIIGKPTEPPPRSSQLERTALAAMRYEDRMQTPPIRKLRDEARPAAMLAPGVEDSFLNKPHKKLLPEVLPGKPGEALFFFVEAQRREATIRRHIASRIRRSINCGGHIIWPVRVTWTCPVCNQKNYHMPARDLLATKCAECGAQTSPDEDII